VKTVLVVDDSETIRHQVKSALSGAGFAVLEAIDGFEALDRIDNHPEISLVILDVNMPRMGGLEMLEAMRGRPKVAKVPVLILTTEAQESLIARAKNAGAKGWVVKPVNTELLVGAVKKITVSV